MWGGTLAVLLKVKHCWRAESLPHTHTCYTVGFASLKWVEWRYPSTSMVNHVTVTEGREALISASLISGTFITWKLRLCKWALLTSLLYPPCLTSTHQRKKVMTSGSPFDFTFRIASKQYTLQRENVRKIVAHVPYHLSLTRPCTMKMNMCKLWRNWQNSMAKAPNFPHNL